jgi:hypothetical protein
MKAGDQNETRTSRTKSREMPPDERMTAREKEDLIEQIEEFEGPDRREKRGTPANEPHEAGVARS